VNAIATALGHLIGLALIPAALIWVLRGTRPGRVVWDACAHTRAARRARRDRRAHQALADAHQRWLNDYTWWCWHRSQHGPGTPQFELATTILQNLELRRPPCPHDGWTCPVPHCPNHPRSHQP